MSEQKPIPVRLSEDVIARLDRVATKIGSNRAALIRMCTQTFLAHVEKQGTGALPANWREIIESADGRRSAPQQRAVEPPAKPPATPKKRKTP